MSPSEAKAEHVRPSPANWKRFLPRRRHASHLSILPGRFELPMNPPSDVTLMRTGRWPLSDFRRAVKSSLDWCVERGMAWDFLSHPSALRSGRSEIRDHRHDYRERTPRRSARAPGGSTPWRMLTVRASHEIRTK